MAETPEFKRERVNWHGHYTDTYESITSLEGLLVAWREFRKGKRHKIDVAAFEMRLIDSLIALHRDLVAGRYRHGPYCAFVITDPKRREIHKAQVRDRIVHHLLYRALYPYFDRRFIHDSYSCRESKGVHRALERFAAFGRKVSKNNTATAWVLKGDIRKFFASIDHSVLKTILAQHIVDARILALIGHVIDSFETPDRPGVGLPLGNLTSQLLVNIYMNEFDQYVKRTLKMRHYIRYADDFVLMSHDRAALTRALPCMEAFLRGRLKLEMHPKKIFLKTLASGVDFLGWVHFPDHRVLRTVTKRRMFVRVRQSPTPATLASYRGLLQHGNAKRLANRL